MEKSLTVAVEMEKPLTGRKRDIVSGMCVTIFGLFNQNLGQKVVGIEPSPCTVNLCMAQLN